MRNLEGDADANTERAAQENMLQIQRQQQEAADYQAEQENLRQAIVASETEAQRHASEALEFQKQLKRIMAQSVLEQGQSGSEKEGGPGKGFHTEENYKFEPAVKKSAKMAERAVAVAGGSASNQRPYLYDPGHLAGTRQNEFEAHQQKNPEEKTAQERTRKISCWSTSRSRAFWKCTIRTKARAVPQP